MKIQLQHNYPEECNITPVIAFTTEPWKGIYIGWIYWCLIIYFTEPVFYEPNKAKAWYKFEKINLKQKIDRLQGYVDEYSHENESMKIHIKLLEKTAQNEIDKLKIKKLVLEKDNEMLEITVSQFESENMDLKLKNERLEEKESK